MNNYDISVFVKPVLMGHGGFEYEIKTVVYKDSNPFGEPVISRVSEYGQIKNYRDIAIRDAKVRIDRDVAIAREQARVGHFSKNVSYSGPEDN